jgi:hypothetical protein
MPRPQNKEQLFEQANLNFEKLQTLINSFTPTQQEATFPFEDRDRNIKDVLIHLYERHQLLLNRESSNMKGKKSDFLPAPYNRKTYPQMNIEFWKQHQKTSLADAKNRVEKSHQATMKMIESHTNEELFTKKFYSRTGTTSLGGYCVSATSSHYDWAIKKIKKYQKELK